MARQTLIPSLTANRPPGSRSTPFDNTSGISKTCSNVMELRDKNAELQGRIPVQFRFYLPAPKPTHE